MDNLFIVMDKIRPFINLEFSSFPGIVNFFSFVIIVLANASSKVFRGLAWFIENAFLIFGRDKQRNLNPIRYPESKIGNGFYLIVFAFLIICMVFLSAVQKQ